MRRFRTHVWTFIEALISPRVGNAFQLHQFLFDDKLPHQMVIRLVLPTNYLTCANSVVRRDVTLVGVAPKNGVLPDLVVSGTLRFASVSPRITNLRVRLEDTVCLSALAFEPVQGARGNVVLSGLKVLNGGISVRNHGSLQVLDTSITGAQMAYCIQGTESVWIAAQKPTGPVPAGQDPPVHLAECNYGIIGYDNGPIKLTGLVLRRVGRWLDLTRAASLEATKCSLFDSGVVGNVNTSGVVALDSCFIKARDNHLKCRSMRCHNTCLDDESQYQWEQIPPTISESYFQMPGVCGTLPGHVSLLQLSASGSLPIQVAKLSATLAPVPAVKVGATLAPVPAVKVGATLAAPAPVPAQAVMRDVPMACNPGSGGSSPISLIADTNFFEDMFGPARQSGSPLGKSVFFEEIMSNARLQWPMHD